MKRSIGIIALVLVVVMAAFAFTGCEVARKIEGAEATFANKVSKAKTLSFKMNVNYKKGDSTTVIDMECYKQDNENGQEEYAYIYTCPQAEHESYKNVYADNKLYESVNLTKYTGSYYVKDGVSVDDDKNIFYHVKKNILLTSVAAFLTKAKKETLNGEDVYRYDVKISDKNVSLWYSSEALVKFYVRFEGENEEPAEEYTISLSDYKFDEEIPDDAFNTTYGLGYIESPIAFETWMEIITSFAGKLGR